MKIDANDEISRSAFADKPVQKESPSDAEFKNILKAAVEQGTQGPTKIQPSAQLDPVSAIRSTSLSAAARHKIVDRVDKLLNLLDHYRNQLADPQVTLRSMEPVVNTIATEKEQLSPVLNALPDCDGLKDIVHRALITASLEVIKYSRGDYIPA